VRVGLTGGIGAGKSAVAAILGELGAFVVDTDAIAREVLADYVIENDGSFDRLDEQVRSIFEKLALP
jgi:dephospho-CoA kinase